MIVIGQKSGIGWALDPDRRVATPSGWGSHTAMVLGQFFPELQAARQGATIYSFALPDAVGAGR